MSKSHDVHGKPYLKLTEAKAGQIVSIDRGFDCHSGGLELLNKDEKGLYFSCAEGKHYIDGQCDDGIHCIGIYP